jgi:hypothetical protein
VALKVDRLPASAQLVSRYVELELTKSKLECESGCDMGLDALRARTMLCSASEKLQINFRCSLWSFNPGQCHCCTGGRSTRGTHPRHSKQEGET